MTPLLEFDKKIGSFENMETFDPDKTETALDHRDSYGCLIYPLYYRPKYLRMETVGGIDELKTYCKAVTVGWRLWPHHWTTFQHIIDYLSMYTLLEDVKRMETPFLLTLKDIAVKNENDSGFGGLFMAPQAKRIIFQWKTPLPPGGIASMRMNPLMLKAMLSGMKPGPGGPVEMEICGGIDCLEVETRVVTFPRCGKCKKVVYHSKECQRKAWHAGHKKVCKAPPV